MAKSDDLTGKKFGMLLVVSRAENNKWGKSVWNCLCDCGETTTARGVALRNEIKRSCGCLQRKTASDLNIVHGFARNEKERLYNIWCGIKERCNSPNNKAYMYYGGRGITICKEWDSDYVSFRDWAMQNGYADNLSIDRIDVNGNYEPGNCRWATAEEQANNKRNTINIPLNGTTKTVREWSALTGISEKALRWRRSVGKTPEEILKGGKAL